MGTYWLLSPVSVNHAVNGKEPNVYIDLILKIFFAPRYRCNNKVFMHNWRMQIPVKTNQITSEVDHRM